MARTRPDIDDARTDMTPMIDVVFLMIVFFVCIDFRTLEAKLPAYLPRDVGTILARVEPEEQLAVRVHVVATGTRVHDTRARSDGLDPATGRPARHRLVGHRVAWEVGPRRFDDLDAAGRELQRIARDPAHHVVDRTSGERRPMRVTVEGLRGTCYEDVARAADACHAAGFAAIHFGGGES